MRKPCKPRREAPTSPIWPVPWAPLPPVIYPLPRVEPVVVAEPLVDVDQFVPLDRVLH